MDGFVIFQSFPGLKENVPWMSIGGFPTRVHPLEKVGEELGADLWIKRDDESGKLYGGNKVRKLEFLLADALEKGAKSIITSGGIGSHHCLAVTIYGTKFGFTPVLILFRQPLTQHSSETLMLDHHFGAEMHYGGPYLRTSLVAMKQVAIRSLRGENPYILFPGGSTPLSTLGYANAMLELDMQIEEGRMPSPDYIFVPLGSCGTMAGLCAGRALTKLESGIVGVRVTDRILANRFYVVYLANRALGFIERYGGERAKVSLKDVQIFHNYFGGEYGLVTEEAKDAINFMEEHEGIHLDGTYTGKAFAALTDFVQRKEYREKTVLFWNTFSSVSFDSVLDECRYKSLPDEFMQFFEPRS